MRKIALLLRNEIIKARNGKLACIGVGVCGVICLILFATIRQKEVGALNGWIFTQMVMLSLFTEMGMIFIALFAAQLFAEEAGSGTIRLGLCAPVKRYQYFLAKVIAGHLYMAGLTLIVLTFTVALGMSKHGFGPVEDTFGVIYPTSQAVRCLATTVVLSWLPLGAVVMVALLISVLTRRAVIAMGTTIGLIIMIETLKHMIGIGPWLCTNYLSFPWIIFHEMAQGVDYRWFPELWKMLVVCGATWLACFAIALSRFCRQDLNY